MSLFTLKSNHLLGIASLLTLPVAMVLATMYKLEVCSMCVSQRVTFVLLGLSFILWNKIGKVIFALSSVVGIWLSVRHTYIMYNPNKAVNSCGADLSFLWDMGQYVEVLKSLMLGGIDCTKEKFTIMGLYIPEWSLISFLILSTAGTFLVINERYNKS